MEASASRCGNVYLCHWALRSRPLPCCTPVRKTNQRLVLCVPVLLYCPVGESTSGARQSCVRGMPVFALSSEFCIVQVLEGAKNLSALRIVRCPRLGLFLSIVLITLSPDCIKLPCKRGYHYSGRCPLREFSRFCLPKVTWHHGM